MLLWGLKVRLPATMGPQKEGSYRCLCGVTAVCRVCRQPWRWLLMLPISHSSGLTLLLCPMSPSTHGAMTAAFDRVMGSTDCQLDRIWNHLRHRPPGILCVCMRVILIVLSEVGDLPTTPWLGSYLKWRRGLRSSICSYEQRRKMSQIHILKMYSQITSL